MIRLAETGSTFLANVVGALKPCTAVLGLLALAACSMAPKQSTTAQNDERRLFVEANESILEYHIKPGQPDQLALTGLSKLSTIDPLVSIERTADKVILHRDDSVRRFDAPGMSELIDWSVLTAKVVDAAREMSPTIAALPPGQLDEIVIDGTLAKLDPYSRYVRPEVARERRASRDGFGGIGVTLDIHERDVRIAGVLPDTPAAVAGLLADDRILALDGVPIERLTADDIRVHLRGAAQTMVQLAVARNGVATPMQISVQRARIVPETVTLQEDGGIAWLKVRSFNQQTGKSVAEMLQQAHRDLGPNLHGLVLDLRDNPGGLLDQSVEVVSQFVQNGDITSTIGRNPQAMQRFTATNKQPVETLPLVVLVNGGSASASEIVASALQDSGRAVIVGTSSYGKGTVQTVVHTSNDGELTVTWAQLITPGGYQLNTHGVVPTVCTADLPDTPDTVNTLLSDSAKPAGLAQSRVSLDDDGWHRLRALCPAQRDKRSIDSLAATRLLSSPTLYQHVLAEMSHPSSRVASNRPIR
jgi:carboxyl-terminal processing protease